MDCPADCYGKKLMDRKNFRLFFAARLAQSHKMTSGVIRRGVVIRLIQGTERVTIPFGRSDNNRIILRSAVWAEFRCIMSNIMAAAGDLPHVQSNSSDRPVLAAWHLGLR